MMSIPRKEQQKGSRMKVYRMKPLTCSVCGCITPSMGCRNPSTLMTISGMALAGMATNLGMSVPKTEKEPSERQPLRNSS